MVDQYDDGQETSDEALLKRSGKTKIPPRQTAVAVKDSEKKGEAPLIKAAGRGKIAEKIIALAFENGIKVREDGPLAEMLAKIEIDSPIPSEAFMAVAEILSYVYRANGEPNPFDAILKDENETE